MSKKRLVVGLASALVVAGTAFGAGSDVRIFCGDARHAYRDPAVVWHDGTFHLFFTLVETEADGQVFSYAAQSESTDLVRWTPPRKLTPRDNAKDYSSPGNVVKDGDEWVLCLQTYPRPGNRDDGTVRYASEDARLFTMRSRDLRGWTAPELLKVKGPDVPEEAMGRMIDPYLLKLPDGGWMCFYKQDGVSFSKSPDLKTWTSVGRAEAGENVCVVRDGGRYLMVHSPENGLGLKASADLVHWQDLPGRITLGQADWPWARGRLTAGFLLDARQVEGVGQWLLFFHASGPRKECEGDFDRNASLALVRAETVEELLDRSSPGVARELTISVAKDVRPSLALAARELGEHLRLMTGKAPRVTNDEGGMFRLGMRPAGAGEAKPFEARYRIAGGAVQFWGDRREDGYDGVLMAVYDFLEKELGFRWICPGEAGVVVPAMNEVRLADGHEGRYVPPYDIGRVRNANFDDLLAFHLPLLDGNRVNVPAPLKYTEEGARALRNRVGEWYRRNGNWSKFIFPYGHAFTHWHERFAKTHPEYLAMDEKGVRGNAENPTRSMVCVSCPGAVDQVLADWQAAGCPRYVNACENDGGGLCRCAACCALDVTRPGENFHDHKTDRYLNFWNRIAAKAKAIRPDVQVVGYIYAFYRHPPRRERVEHPDNMVFGTVPTFADDWRAFYEGWKAVGLRRFFLRPNFHCSTESLPRGVEKMLYDVFSHCRDNGMIGADFDAYPERFPTAIESYVAVRLLKDPRLGFDEIMDDYCRAYGEAAPAVREYFARIRARRAASDAKVKAEAGKRNMLDDSQHAVYQLRPHTEEALLGDRAVLEAAWKAGVSSDAARRRLKTLLVRANEYVLVYRFLTAGKGEDREAVRTAGRKLLDYRLRHVDDLMDSYEMTMNSRVPGTETRTWLRVGDLQESLIQGGLR